jgi:hypothetical protein
MKKFCVLIFILFPALSFGQILIKLKASNKSEFEKARQREPEFAKNAHIKKIDTTIKVKTTKGKIIEFKDDLSDENFKTFEYAGDLVNGKIALIMVQDYNTDRYIALNLLTEDQKTFIGTPHVLMDKIVCLQGVETDVKQILELWRNEDGKLKMIETFTFPDGIYPANIAW